MTHYRTIRSAAEVKSSLKICKADATLRDVVYPCTENEISNVTQIQRPPQKASETNTLIRRHLV